MMYDKKWKKIYAYSLQQTYFSHSEMFLGSVYLHAPPPHHQQ